MPTLHLYYTIQVSGCQQGILSFRLPIFFWQTFYIFPYLHLYYIIPIRACQQETLSFRLLLLLDNSNSVCYNIWFSNKLSVCLQELSNGVIFDNSYKQVRDFSYYTNYTILVYACQWEIVSFRLAVRLTQSYQTREPNFRLLPL